MKKKITVNTMALAYQYFQDAYRRSYEYSKMINGVIVDSETHFTFAEDLSVYRNEKDINAYIERNLKRFRASGIQSYFEMILAVEAVSWVFHECGLDNLCDRCSEWDLRLKNLNESGYYRDYITDAQLDSIYNLD